MSSNKNIKVSAAALKIKTYRAGIRTRSREPNKAKFLREETKDYTWSNDSGVRIFVHRIIDRESDSYFEIVTNDETGEVLRECKEKLSEHQGRGSAKGFNMSK